MPVAPLVAPDDWNSTSPVPSRKALSYSSAHSRVSLMSITMAPMIDPTATVQTHTSLEPDSYHSGKDFPLTLPTGSLSIAQACACSTRG